MMAGNIFWEIFSNQIYDFELKYLEIYITRSKTLYWFPKTFYLWTKWYNFYIYNFNKNGKNCGRKDIWCAKSEVIFSTLNMYLYMKLRGPGQKLVVDFQRHFIHNKNDVKFILIISKEKSVSRTHSSYFIADQVLKHTPTTLEKYVVD